VSLTDAQLRTAARVLLPGLTEARAQAARVASASNIRQILICCILYANDNKNMLPATLEDAARSSQLPERVLINPRDPKGRRYVYKPWVLDLRKYPADGQTPLVWEETEEPQLNVGFVDGHVELMERAAFEQAVNKAERVGK
jgi:prepilin-type processing-associated H-X9-DG protein